MADIANRRTMPSLELLQDQGADFDEAMRIYESAFPVDEREPRDYFIRLMLEIRPEVQPLTWAIKDGAEVIGMAHLVGNRKTGALFFVYVAIRPDFRGRFSAKLLMRQIVDRSVQLCAETGIRPTGVIFEVERIEDAKYDQELSFRKKRLAFFHSLGAVVLTRCYVQPALTPDRAPVPLNLMFVPFNSDWNRDELIVEMYRSVFGLDETHPYVISSISEAC